MTPQSVDLALAVNYLPACVCVLKCLALGGALCAARAGDSPPAYVALLVLVLLDRLLSPSVIFDGNSLLLAVWGGHVMAEVQAHSQAHAQANSQATNVHEAVYGLLSLTWVAFAVRQLLKLGHGSRRMAGICSSLGVAAHVAAIAFVPVPPEPHAVRLARCVAFPLLAIGWLYAVVLRDLEASRKDGFSAVHFVPVLCAHPYAALAHVAVVFLVGLLWKHAPPVCHLPVQGDVDGLEELERVFRQAKSSKFASSI